MTLRWKCDSASRAVALLLTTPLFVWCSSGDAVERGTDSGGEDAETRQALGAFNVLTRAYGNERSGANLAETALKPSNINRSQFGKLFELPVDDEVYAQPLYASSVSVAGTARNVVYVATVNNTVYAFDADNGAALWSHNYNGSGRAPRTTDVANGNACNGTYRDFGGNIGIVSTPVIDGASSTLYFVTRTLEAGAMVYRLRAVNLADGNDRANSPKVITATVNGSGLASSGGKLTFDPMFHNQRAALALGSNSVYVAFASYCDTNPYHGWMMGYDATSLASTGVFVTTPNGADGGIWLAGAAPAIDANGNVYVTTGNGTFDGNTGFGETLLKLAPRTLSLLDYFTPSNFTDLNGHDNDFGSAGPSFVPGTNLLVNGGKQGRVYLVNGGNLGHMVPDDAQIPQRFDPIDAAARPTATHHIHNQVVVWKSPTGTNLYVWGENDYLRAFRFDAAAQRFNTTPFAVGSVLPPWGMPGGMISLSANGSVAGSGVLWATTPAYGDANQATVPGMLRAFDAENLSLLWESTAPGDDIFAFAKGNAPLVANGRVYVPSLSGAVSVFGQRSGPTPAVTESIYQIRTGTAAERCVDVSASGTADGTNIQQYTCNGTNAQRFRLVNVVNDIYEIRNVISNKCVDVSNAGTAAGTNVQLMTCNGTPQQRWAVQPLGNGQYRLQPQTGANLCMDVSNSGTYDGANVQEWPCNGTRAQVFTLALDNPGTAPIPNRAFRIATSTTTGQCVDVENGSTNAGANIRQWECNGSDSQRFRFRSLGGNLYEVRAAVSEKCLDVQGAGTADGTNVQQWECNAGVAQIWSIDALGTGRYRFSPQTAANKCLDVQNAGTKSGMNIWEWTCNGTVAQKFSIIAP